MGHLRRLRGTCNNHKHSMIIQHEGTMQINLRYNAKRQTLTFVLVLEVLNFINGYLFEEKAKVLVPVSVIWGNVFIIYLT